MPNKKITKPTIYTEEYVLNEVREIYQWLWTTDEGRQSLFLEEIVLLMNKSYTTQRFREWRKVFKNHEEISATIRKIKHTLELRLVKGGLSRRFEPGLTKFCLINNYGYVERIEPSDPTKKKKREDTLNLDKYTEQELEELERLLKIGDIKDANT